MLNAKILFTKILTELKGLKQEAVVKEGCTVFRQGDLRIVRIDTPSAWSATLSAGDRPSADVSAVGKVYNGSTYVDCLIFINTSGQLKVQDFWGGTIANAQYGFLRPRTLTYFVD